MKVSLDQDEIEQAVEAYVRSQIAIADGQEIGIDFKMGRSPAALSADLDIRTAGTAAAAASKPAPSKPALVTQTDTPEETQPEPVEEEQVPDAGEEQNDSPEADAPEPEPEQTDGADEPEKKTAAPKAGSIFSKKSPQQQTA